MKQLSILFILLVLNFSCTNQKSKSNITPVSFTKVNLTDNFWKPRIEINQKVTIPHAFQMCEETGRFRNFEIAVGKKSGEYSGIYPFDDSDAYKIIEGAAYSLHSNPDAALEAYTDSVIDLITDAQEEDGYLMTWRTINPNKPPSSWSGSAERWSDVSSGHELYCAGHLYEAAVAYYQATGKSKLLDVALKNAELILNVFGPGKIEEPPGHQEIELGLIKLYRITNDDRYLQLADFFLQQRGKKKYDRTSKDMWKNGTYWQDHKPVTEQREAAGHAVRATYMYSAMAEVASLSSIDSYSKPLDQLWENVVEKKLYISGGVGAIGNGEAFGDNYDLPNLSAYNETCASVGNVFWNHRMFLLHGDAKYIDVMERTMYNGLISGISLDGTQFFYPNVLESKGHDQRSSWFRCACCPGNITRFMASLPGYVYATGPGNIYLNLFVQNNAELMIADVVVNVSQNTDYPWKGEVEIQIEPEEPIKFDLNVRIPGWAKNKPVSGDLYMFLNKLQTENVIIVNGEKVDYDIVNGYAIISKKWEKGDIVKLDLSMSIRRVLCNEEVESNVDKVAIQKGPIVYCAEGLDNEGGPICNLVLANDAVLTSQYHANVLHGIEVISGVAIALDYNELTEQLTSKEQAINLIPYYTWAHRGKSDMAVWLAHEKSAAMPANSPPINSLAKIKISAGKNPLAVNDELIPVNNKVPEYFTCLQDSDLVHWIEYEFSESQELSAASVYWVSNKSMGYAVPDEWRIFYKLKDQWVRVYTEQDYRTRPGEFNLVEFETIRTNSIRLEMTPKKNSLLGIYEWSVE